PLTPNGKVDRKRLPAPRAEGRGQNNHKNSAPRTREEKIMAHIWQRVLKLERVNIDDDFFNVGGDSIKTIRLVSAINEELSSHLQILDLYTHGTIRQLCTLVNRNQSKERQTLYMDVTAKMAALKERVLKQNPVLADVVEDLYPMSDIEKGMVFYYLKYAGTGIYHDQFVYPIRYADFDRQRFQKALELLIARHPILRTGFNMEGYNEPLQLVYRSIHLPVTYGDFSRFSLSRRKEEIEALMEADRGKPFDAAVPPLWRMQMITLDEFNLCLLFIFHHAILDGW
ncbi:MAG: hypothetical protein GY940_47130, partial [bacterium]|nr:hypothetical protein [bacterium]